MYFSVFCLSTSIIIYSILSTTYSIHYILVNTMNNRNNSQSSTVFVKITSLDAYESSWRIFVVAYSTDYNPVFLSGLSVSVRRPIGLLFLVKHFFGLDTTLINNNMKTFLNQVVT